MVLEFPYVLMLVVLKGIDHRRLSKEPGGLLVCLEFLLHEVLTPLLSENEILGVVIGRDRIVSLAGFPLALKIEGGFLYNRLIAHFGVLRRVLCRVLGGIEEISDIGRELPDIFVAPFVDGFEILLHIVIDFFEFLAHNDLEGDLLGFQCSDRADIILYGFCLSCLVCLDASVDISRIFRSGSKKRGE